jgi:hypothetical protein
MAVKEWSTTYPVTQDPDTFTNQPDLVNGADDTRVSQIHTLRGKVHEVAKEVGTNPGNAPAGCLRARVATLEASGSNDPDAIHDNVAGEIDLVTEKPTPVSGDLLIIEDSAAGNAKKKVQIGNLPGGGADADAIHDNVAAEIAAVTEKTTPVGADLLLIEDSAAGNIKKRVQITNLPGGGGTDADAIHDNVAGEIAAVAAKTQPLDADVFLIEDFADSNNKKKVIVGACSSVRMLARASAPGNVAATGFLYTKTTEGQTNLYYENQDGDEIQLTNDDIAIASDLAAYHSNQTGEISTTPEKTTPVGADVLVIEDSAASYAKKRVQITNLPGGGGGGTLDRYSVFADDTEFSESGASYVTKKTFRIVRDSAKKPTSWRLVVSLWTVGGTSAECQLQVGATDAANVSSTETSETAASIKKIDLTVVEGNEPENTFLTVNIDLKQTGGGVAHLKFTELYAIFT